MNPIHLARFQIFQTMMGMLTFVNDLHDHADELDEPGATMLAACLVLTTKYARTAILILNEPDVVQPSSMFGGRR